MIKCNLTVCGVITRAAELKEKKESGEKFISFKIKYPVRDRNGESMDMEISVSMPGDKAQLSLYPVGRRVRVSGILHPKKRKDAMFFNLRSEGGDILVPTKEEDSLEGTMEFRGKIGKKGVDSRSGKNGSPYKAFSAYSSDKDGENKEYTWVRFLYFDPKDGEDFLKAEGLVECKGDLRLGVVKGSISLECLLKEVSEWVIPEKSEK